MLAVKRLSFLLVVAISACGGHRTHNPSTHLPPEQLTLQDSTLIPYRTLVVDDFKAVRFPGVKDPDVEGDVGAASVIIMTTTPCLFRAMVRANEDSLFWEAFADSFRYEARFSQIHSWFNPAHSSEPGPLLAHEQIHFAIAEIVARRANAQIEEIRARIRGRARDQTIALRLAQRRFDEELIGIRMKMTERQSQFDRETENGTHIRESKSWSVRIRRELEAPPQIP